MVGTPPAGGGSDRDLFPSATVTFSWAQVHEAQLALLIGLGRDPITGDRLTVRSPTIRARRLGSLEGDAEIPATCVARTATPKERIEGEEGARSSCRPVAGVDFTCSAPKSVLVLSGVADADLQAMIVEARHAAVAEGPLEGDSSALQGGSDGQLGVVREFLVGI
jgi:hypothetical protein